QSVEQMTVNHWVPGSSPGRGAKFKSPDARRGFFVPDDRSGARARCRVGPARLKPSGAAALLLDRKSTRLNSSHVKTSYAVFCLKKKNSAPPSPKPPEW